MNVEEEAVDAEDVGLIGDILACGTVGDETCRAANIAAFMIGMTVVEDVEDIIVVEDLGWLVGFPLGLDSS